MGKLGKKARKFAKKNLQSVLKRRRKLKSMFKKKATKKHERQGAEDVEEEKSHLPSEVNADFKDVVDVSLDAIFGEDDSDVADDDSDSDGYLSEEESLIHMVGSPSENHVEDNSDDNPLSAQNRVMNKELVKKMKKLDRLKNKDPNFAMFLESNKNRIDAFREDADLYSDEDESGYDGQKPENGSGTTLSSSAVDILYQLIMEQLNVDALKSLLNGYRAACHCGTELSHYLKDGQTFSKILMFVLREVDNIFRKMLHISPGNERKDVISKLKNSPTWKTVKPLVKSYLRSTLFLLNEVSDSEILAFSLTQLRASILYFAPFPALLQRLIKILVHLWATGEGILSLHSFHLIQDVATLFNSDCFDICFVKAYKAFISRCKFVEPVLFEHMQFLKNSFVELCSLDVHRSFIKAMVSIQQLAKILQLGLQTKKKEAVKKIRSWQYANCIELWVAFVSVNINDYDLQPLLYMIIQIINGVAILFPGARYLPLRVKCVQWLNQLSSSSGVFIPVASLAMDVSEYKVDKGGRKAGRNLSFSSNMKLPKHWLKSQKFQEQCIFSAIELLAVHFAQWSHHISFPELATIPVIRLRKLHETITIDKLKRAVKRFIDQVEQNIEFVRKKRDEVAFSPKDLQSVDSFLQLEKRSSNVPFTQYYRSLMEKSSSRNLLSNENTSNQEQKKSNRKRKRPNKTVDVAVDGEANSD